MTIDWLKDRTTGQPFYPVTHEDAVIDSNSVTLSTKLNQKQDKLGKVIGSFNRTNVNGSGSLSISGTAGQFPTISTAGTYTVVTYMKSSTSSYTLNVTFGSNSYSLTSSSGIINDSRQLTLSANSTWSGSVTTVAANTEILVYIVSTENVYGISKAGITGNYNDLINKPSIPSAPGTLNTNNSTAQTVSSSEALSGTIKLHKISKTGSYNDLLNKPTIPDVSGKENTSNKVTSISSSSTNTQYPSAKAVYDAIQNVQVQIPIIDLTDDDDSSSN